jgi:hypothetical protein
MFFEITLKKKTRRTEEILTSTRIHSTAVADDKNVPVERVLGEREKGLFDLQHRLQEVLLKVEGRLSAEI